MVFAGVDFDRVDAHYLYKFLTKLKPDVICVPIAADYASEFTYTQNEDKIVD